MFGEKNPYTFIYRYAMTNRYIVLLKSRQHLPESAFFEQFASSRVPAWITVARVNHVFAMFTVISGVASALVLPFGQRLAEAFVRTRVGEAGVTLGQDVFADRFCENDKVILLQQFTNAHKPTSSLYRPLQTKLETGVDSRSLSFMELGSAHLAIPDSMKSFFIHSANHCRPQSQYSGLEPIPLQNYKNIHQHGLLV